MPSIARSPAAEKQPPEQPLEQLRPRLASTRRLLLDLEQEYVAAGGTLQPIPLCGHDDRPVATVLVNGRPACNECAARSLGYPTREEAEAAARETQTEYAAHFKLLPDSDHDLGDCQTGALR